MASIDGLFSMLPDDILHQILYSLTLRQRVKASVVCKSWGDAIASFNDKQTHELCRCGNRKPCIIIRDYYMCCTFQSLIKLAAADNSTSFTEFYMFVPDYKSYNLSPFILESRLLTILHLKRCTIEEKVIDDIKELPSLKEIYFRSVWISSTTCSKFISKCPSIVELTLIDNYYCRCILVPHMNELKKVHLDGEIIEAIDIKARNLQEFHLFSSSSEPLKFDLRACTKLQILKIDCQYLPVGFPEDISSAFPHLKSLFLRLCRRLNEIKLVNPQLEKFTLGDMVDFFTLGDMVDLDDAIIVTPTLRFTKVPITTPEVCSGLTEVEIRLKHVHGLKHVHAINRLPHLRTYAEKFGENITFYLETQAAESKDGRNIQPLCIKHIHLEILISWEPKYESFINELFGYLHPQSLSVRQRLKIRTEGNFIQVLLAELRGRKMAECCQCSNYKCWRHHLKGFKELGSTKREGVYTQISLVFLW